MRVFFRVFFIYKSYKCSASKAKEGTPYQPVTPVVAPHGGRYPSPIKVRITSSTTNANIYYTTDGTTPAFSGGGPQGTTQLYSGPIAVSGTTTIKSIAVSEGQFVSEVSKSAQFYIGTQYIPGSDWYDTNGHLIESHSGEVKFFEGKYYWYGQIQNTYMPEWERVGVSCYSSTDLVNWKDEGPVLYLSTTTTPISSTATIVERPHVIYNSTTHKYVLWGHNWVGGTGAGSAALVAYNDTPYGAFTIASSTYNPNGYGLNDMNLFKDDDGTAYLLYSSATDSNGHFFISKLSSDYLTTTAEYINPPSMTGANKREAPAMFKRNGVYFILSSGVTGWVANENKYSTSSSPLGTWSTLVNEFQPSAYEDYLFAYRSQGSNVITIPGRTDGYVYMGDRFDPGLVSGGSNSNQGALMLYDTRHVWLPITFPNDNTISISYSPSWTLDGAFVTSQGPATSTGFSATPSGLSVGLSWTNNETNGYTLYVDRATDSGFTQNLISDLVTSNTTSYTDTNVSYGNNYFYRTRTVTAAGTGYSVTRSVDLGAEPDLTAPSVTLTAPLAGATIVGTTTLSATSSDNVGIASVQFYVDGTSTGAVGATSTYSIPWDSTSVSDGSHTITVVAIDNSSNRATSSVSINVSNLVTRPTLSSVNISSSNGFSGYAKSDDIITLIFTADQNLNATPTVTISGNSVAASPTGVANHYIATYTMTDSDSGGLIPFTIDFADTINVSGFTVTNTTDSSRVTYDKTPPTVSAYNLPTNAEYSSVFSHVFATTTDSGSGLSTYQWSEISGLGVITFGSPTSLITNMSADKNDNYVARLTVTDHVGNSNYLDFNFRWVPTTGLAITNVSPVGVSVPVSASTSLIAFNKNITLLDASKITLVDNDSGATKSLSVSVYLGNGSSSVLNIDYPLLENNRYYRLTINQNAIRDDDGNTNNGGVYYFHTVDSNSPATLAVTGVDAQKTYAISDGTYTNGWRWVFHVTVPDLENNLNIKFDNWTSGSNSLSTANNMRFYSIQSSNGATSGSAITIPFAGSYGAGVLNLVSDLDSTKAGRQVDVVVEMQLPVGTANGSYSTSYGIKTE